MDGICVNTRLRFAGAEQYQFLHKAARAISEAGMLGLPALRQGNANGRLYSS